MMVEATTWPAGKKDWADQQAWAAGYRESWLVEYKEWVEEQDQPVNKTAAFESVERQVPAMQNPIP